MPILHESLEHENAAGELLKVLEAALEQKFGRRMGIGMFIFDFGEGGFLGWASNAQRADTATTLIEWLGTNEPAILNQAIERWHAQQLLGIGAERSH